MFYLRMLDFYRLAGPHVGGLEDPELDPPDKDGKASEELTSHGAFAT